MSKIRCPVGDCQYWVAWGGYLEPTLRVFKKHVRKDHLELQGFFTRRDGGVIDTAFGDAIAAAFVYQDNEVAA